MWIKHRRMAEEDGTLLGGAAGTPTPEAAPSGEEAKFIEEGWLKGADTAFATDKIMETVKDVPTLVKNYVHAQRMVGRDKAIIPDENADAQTIKDFFHKVGLPTEDKYELATKESTLLEEDFRNEFKKLAYENNILPKQANAILDFYESKMDGEEKQSKEEASAKATESIQALKDEWGEGFQKQMGLAVDVVNNFDNGQGMMKYLDESGLGNDTKLIKFLAHVGSQLNEDTFKSDAVGHMGLTGDEIQAEMNAMFSNADSPYWKKDHADHQRQVDRMTKLQAMVAK